MSEVKYTRIPHVEKKVSRIFYGTAMMPFLAGTDGSELFDAIYGLGINAFDTARGYGGAEISLGRWVAERGIRDQVVILSKCAHPDSFGNKRVNETAIREDFAQSREALQTDYIDIYLLHRDDLDVPAGEVVEIMNALHEEGKIGAFGGSNWTHERIQQANEYAYRHNLIPFTLSSPNFGLADQVRDPWGGGCITISGPSNWHARKWYQENKMPVIAYSSLGRGLFSGRVKSSELNCISEVLDEVALKGYGDPANYERLRRCEELAQVKNCTVPQIAMAWIYHQPVDTFAVVSTSSPKRMQENIDSLSISLTDIECRYLDLQTSIS